MHNWTMEDNRLVIDAYYRNLSDLELDELSQRIGTTLKSIKMKIKNVEYLDTNGESGLAHADNLLREVFDEYRR